MRAKRIVETEPREGIDRTDTAAAVSVVPREVAVLRADEGDSSDLRVKPARLSEASRATGDALKPPTIPVVDAPPRVDLPLPNGPSAPTPAVAAFSKTPSFPAAPELPAERPADTGFGEVVKTAPASLALLVTTAPNPEPEPKTTFPAAPEQPPEPPASAGLADVRHSVPVAEVHKAPIARTHEHVPLKLADQRQAPGYRARWLRLGAAIAIVVVVAAIVYRVLVKRDSGGDHGD